MKGKKIEAVWHIFWNMLCLWISERRWKTVYELCRCIKNTTIERIDVNWNYSKENCKRATLEEQANNTRRNTWETKFARDNWLSINFVHYRYYIKKLSFDEVLEKAKDKWLYIITE